MPEQSTPPPQWQRDLQHQVIWALAIKFAALLVLWFFFFRGSHP
jgi:hypothetical protein